MANDTTFVPGVTKLEMAPSIPPLPVAELSEEVRLVCSAENFAQQPLNVGRDLEEIGVKVADDGLRHRLIYARMDLARAGAEQQALRRMNRNVFHDGWFFQSSRHEHLRKVDASSIVSRRKPGMVMRH